MKHILILMVLFFMSSCSAKILTSTTDSKHTERYVDTIVTTITDSSFIKALLECDSMGRVRIKELNQKNGTLLQQYLELQDNLLKIQANGLTQIRYREKIITDTLEVYIEVPKPYPVEKIVYKAKEKVVYKQRWYQNILSWLGIFYLGKSILQIGLDWKQLTIKTILKILF